MSSQIEVGVDGRMNGAGGTILMLTPFAGFPYDFGMLETLRDQFPDADPVHLAALGDVWSVEVSKIVERMLGIAKDRGLTGLPVQARPEARFQLANLVRMVEGQVIKRKTAGTSIETIDAGAERDALTSSLIQDRIENTATILADHAWLPLCERWWNRFPMIPRDSAKSAKRIPRRPANGGGGRHHFTPRSGTSTGLPTTNCASTRLV